MKQKICVLGAGNVGKAIAIDLMKEGFEVTIIDNGQKFSDFPAGIQYSSGDILNNKILKDFISASDLVIGALPGSIGFTVAKNVISLGKNIIDISFCPEDYMQLDALARKNNVVLIPDAGVAPGLCNVICGYYNKRMKINSYSCMVGGLPVVREWPLEYKASWSPADVIEEYVRPARMVENGKMFINPALSGSEIINVEGIGQLEAFNSDGLRSLLYTMKNIPDMVEKTLRYPGTVEYLRVLRELGYFSIDQVDVGGVLIRPVDLTTKLLFPIWELKKGESEFTFMRVKVNGMKDKLYHEYTYDIYDLYDKETDTSSMARTTGYSCASIASLFLKGQIEQKGVCPPEYLGASEENFRFVINYLSNRGIKINVKSL